MGVAKGGTTDLWEQLVGKRAGQLPTEDSARQEPNIAIGKKEPNFFRTPSLKVEDITIHNPAYMQYLHEITHPCADEPEECACPLPGQAKAASMLASDLHKCRQLPLTIDTTPRYIMSTQAPQILSAVSPCSRTIVMLRDPIKRAVSQYNFKTAMTEMKVGSADGHTSSGINSCAQQFLKLTETPSERGAIERARANMNDLSLGATTWERLQSLLTSEEHAFLLSMYPLGLAAWRLHYLQPGFTLVLNSDAYFADRAAVMAEVIDFLYGRPMTQVEHSRTMDPPANSQEFVLQHVADTFINSSSSVGVVVHGVGSVTAGQQQQQQQVAGGATTAADTHASLKPEVLQPDVEEALRSFYERYVNSAMPELLSALRKEGVRLVDFPTDGKPVWHMHR